MTQHGETTSALGEGGGGRGARWPALACGCLLLVVAGNIYAFGVWSEALSLRWPEHERAHGQALLSTLYECTLVGTYVPVSGFFFHKFGTRKTMLVGAVLNTCAYATVYLQFFSGPERAPNVLSYVAFFMIGHATSFIDIAIIGSTVRNFSLQNRGTVMGLLKGYFGLSASLLALVHETGLSASAFLFVLGPVGSALVLICLPWTTSPKSLLESEPLAWWKLRFLLSVEVTIAIVLFLHSVLAQDAPHFVTLVVLVLVAGALGTTFFTDYAILLSRTLRADGVLGGLRAPESADASLNDVFGDSPRHQESSALLEEESRASAQLAREHGTAQVPSSHAAAEDIREECEPTRSGGAEEDKVVSMTMSEALRSGRFWLFFLMLLVTMGGGLFLVGNAARIVASKGGNDSEISMLVSVISVSNCLGRVGIGFLADHPVLQRHNIDRTWLLMGVTLAMGVAQVLFAVLPLYALPLAGILGGASYGASWTLDPTILADICGLEYFGLLYAVVGFAPTFGSLIFSNILASLVFESHATENPDTHVDECFGNQCFGFAHWLTACVAIIASLTAGPLLSRLQARAKAS